MARVIDPALFEGVERGRIEAAAGCGKTESIVRLVAEWGGQRTLILTHTLAGVAALRRRLQTARVSPDRYSLNSIDAWCVRRVSDFPLRCGQLPDASNARFFYPAVRAACLELLASRALDTALGATYGRVLVDEYQDCGPMQHEIVCRVAALLPTFVVGDPLQAVFNFPGAPVVPWQETVAPTFPLLETLDHPWRWEKVGAAALGQWLLEARTRLQDGTGIDLEQLPAGSEWRPLTGNSARDAQAIRTATSFWQRQAGSVLVLANPRQPQRHAELARNGEGLQVVESLDLRGVVEGVTRLDQAAPEDRLRPLLELAHSMMSGVSVDTLIARCNTLRAGRARVGATADEAAALAFIAMPDWRQAQVTLRSMATQPGRRVFRREVFGLLLSSLEAVASGRRPSLEDAIAAARERRRHEGRPVTARVVGSTLLLKGLEADYTVLLDVEQLSPEHLYVALTRATRGMMIFSRDRWLGQRR